MPENDQYPQRDHDTKKPVTLIIVIVIAAAIGLFVYETSDRTAPPTAPSSSNPNALVPPGAGSQSPTAP